MSLPTAHLRLGARWTREHDLLAWRRSDQRAGLWTRVDGGARWGLVLAADARASERTVRAGIDWYP